MVSMITFYGKTACASIRPKDEAFAVLSSPVACFDALLKCWGKETCAPRMQPDWSKDNPTLGQCSITAFLVQDIYGGEVYGVPLGDGNYHCFNVVDGIAFDLTSDQFRRQTLAYSLDYPQSREVHFAKEEKANRYEALKARLAKWCEARR